MRTEPLLMPGAIIIGCGLIGLGLYFGLRPPGTPPPGAGAPVAMTAASPGAPAAATGAAARGSEAPTPAVSPPPASRQLAEQAMNDALLAEKKASFVPRCWEPALAKEALPATSRFTFQIAVDAAGREVARGINEIRGESRGDVSQCLRGLPMGLRITPAPGVPMTFAVDVTFP